MNSSILSNEKTYTEFKTQLCWVISDVYAKGTSSPNENIHSS